MKQAILRAFDAGTYTATVELPGSISAYLSGIPVARNIDSGDMVPGRRVALYFFDLTNPDDAVLFAVWQ